ncbi:MAG: NAD(P)H-hydrate dehydratase [Candidatus Brocadiia bacterium]
MSREDIEEVTRLPLLPERAPDAHKGDFGRVLIVACSPGMTGAGCMAAMAAQKAGAGLVTLALPQSLNVVAEVKLTSAMSRPMPEPNEPVIGGRAADRVLRSAEEFTAVAVGPGLGRAQTTVEAVRRLVRELPVPTVVDADGLNALAGATEALRDAAEVRLLTPHPGEMSRLTGLSVGEVQSARSEVAREFAAEHEVILALKGAGTVVTDGLRVYVNTSGNPGMATGGTGDVLTGLAVGLLCQGLDPFEALQLAVFVHGLAGDVAAARQGMLSMTAEDLLHCVPDAFQMLEGFTEPPEPEEV